MRAKPKFLVQMEKTIKQIEGKLILNERERIRLEAELNSTRDAMDWFIVTQRKGKKNASKRKSSANKASQLL